MENTIALLGRLFGLATNIFMQFFVWRYLFVYFMLKGDKGKYEGSKARYNFMFIVFGVIFYSTVAAVLGGMGRLIRAMSTTPSLRTVPSACGMAPEGTRALL